ncbi:MAG: ABC transporter permease [Lysobacterales bacterium]
MSFSPNRRLHHVYSSAIGTVRAPSQRRIQSILTFGAIAGLTVFTLLAMSHWLGLWGDRATLTDAENHLPASLQHWLGTNAIGQDIAARAAAGAATAFQTGLLVAVLTTVIGGTLGMLAGYFSGRWPDLLVSWLLAVIDAIPFYLLVGALAYAAQGAPGTVIAALTLAFWTSTARYIRAETLKIRETGYVLSARTQGVPVSAILYRHVSPNIRHLLLIQATIIFVAAVKSEVVLSFLGLGDGQSVSWGRMMAESSQDILAGHFLNFVVASGSLVVLVTALNLLTDALADHFDPRYWSQ